MFKKIKQAVRNNKTPLIIFGVGMTASAVAAAVLVAKTKYGMQLQQIDVYLNTEGDTLTLVTRTVSGFIDTIEIPVEL
jgi:hypothetical protein